MKASDEAHLYWMYHRMVHVHKENENLDYMIKMKSIIDDIPVDELRVKFKENSTLEKTAEKLTKDFPHYSVRESMDDSEIKGWFLEALQKGATWKEEKMYCEEEVLQLLLNRPGPYLTDKEITEWFELKKK